MDADMAQRQEELEKSFANRQQAEELKFQQYIDENNKNVRLCEEQVRLVEEHCKEVIAECTEQSIAAERKFKGLLEPIRQYEMEKQERLFYTI